MPLPIQDHGSGDPVVVVGGSLAGIAAAARLAKAGHQVVLLESRDRLGGRWAREDADVLPPVLPFPAPWRDLFKKSGRAFDPELTRAGLALVPADPAVHVFADGARLRLPADRGGQWATLAATYGEPLARSWQELLDHLDETWQRLRPLGLEDEFAATRLDRRLLAGLWPGGSIEDLAGQIGHPHLAAIVRSVAWRLGSTPRQTPGWCAARLSVERMFGRWTLLEQGRPAASRRLIDLLAARLELRRVDVRLGTTVTGIGPHQVRTGNETIAASAVISTVDPWSHLALTGRTDRPVTRSLRWSAPAQAPAIGSRRESGEAPVSETIRHTPTGTIVEYRRPTDGETLVTVHDHTDARPAPGFGTRWQGRRSWLRMPPLRSGLAEVFLASASSRGGNDQWAQLLSGALATYVAHEELTGADIRPTNKAYRG